MAKVISLTFATVAVAASTTAASAPISTGARMVRVTNSTAAIAFVSVGKTATTTNSLPVLAGQFHDILVHQATSLSVILSTGTGTVYVTPVDYMA